METFGCEFIQVYGLTETTGAITQLDGVDHDPENRPSCSARAASPTRGSRCASSTTTGEDVPVGEVGELWTRSHQNMAGYWNNPEATAGGGHRRRLVQDRRRRLSSTPTGSSYLHDRVKDMIVTGGENVYPAEVENALMKHPDVADVAVIGVPDERWGEAVKAIVVRRPATDPTEAELIAFAREPSPASSCPSRSTSPTALPRNPSRQAAQAGAARALLGGR